MYVKRKLPGVDFTKLNFGRKLRYICNGSILTLKFWTKYLPEGKRSKFV
jgi:hypothetical protein